MSNRFEDMVAVADLVQRERAARDARQWDEMATIIIPNRSSMYRGFWAMVPGSLRPLERTPAVRT